MELRLNEQLVKRKEELTEAALIAEERIGKAPEGKLRISKSNGYVRFYNVTAKGSKNGKYINSKAADLVRQLAQKEYDNEVLEKISKELYCLDLYENAVKKGTFENVYDTLSEIRKELIQPIYLSDEDFIKNWLDRKYEKMGFADGEPAYDTVVGTRVRSKSEALISNSLERWEVPQLYEVPLILKGYGKVRPDFMVLNVRTRQEYIWEHLGMLDDPVYLEKAMKKIEAYIANGYIPGINLIITFESSKHPLDLKTVDKLIETFLK